jgi:hypothetical protein
MKLAITFVLAVNLTEFLEVSLKNGSKFLCFIPREIKPVFNILAHPVPYFARFIIVCSILGIGSKASEK